MVYKFRGMEDPDGNLYEIETDETLTVSGIPADAKVVGGEFSKLSQRKLSSETCRKRVS